MKSLSEIETTSKRASKAAGYSWGISEEVGKGIRLLELFGLAGIKNLSEYLPNCSDVNFKIFGLSLATINFFLSIALTSITIRYLYNEKNR